MSMDSANTPGNHQFPDDELSGQAAQRPFDPDGGDGGASVAHAGKDGDPDDDRKPHDAASQSGGPQVDSPQVDKGLSSQTDEDQSSQVDTDDPHKTEKLAEAGRDIDTNDAAD
jgi:hypothetical protein